MPICRTCHGEYERAECQCPSCEQPLGTRGGRLCQHCGADTVGRRMCPRCHSDVTAWERESFSMRQFIGRGGALGMLPTLAAIGMWAVYWRVHPRVIYHPLMTILGVAISQIVLVALFVNRLEWHERWWASQIYRSNNSPLPLTIAASFVAGLACTALAFVMFKMWDVDPTVWQKMLFALAYLLMYGLFTASATLMGMQDYMARLNQRVPQPIFVHIHRLLRVVVETAIKSLMILNGANTVAPNVGRPNRRYEMVEVLRQNEGGGIHTVIREYKLVERPDPATGELHARWDEVLWYIEADQWGHIRVLEPTDMVVVAENAAHRMVGQPWEE